MRESTSSSSHIPSTSTRKLSQKRKWLRAQLLKHLEIVGSLSSPLPPTLPPSPPASRSSSPAPGLKRKADHDSGADHVKRLRVDPVPAKSSTQLPTRAAPMPPPAVIPPPTVHPQKNNPVASTEPREDGEVPEEPVASSSSAPTILPTVPVFSTLPIRRPRRGMKPNPKKVDPHWDELNEKWFNVGRRLKYSGDARHWSTYHNTTREFRPLHDPPPNNSIYHKHGNVIARLELMDALVSFTYAIWSKDYGRGSCHFEVWASSMAFLGWCKTKWESKESSNDEERAFQGLIYLIEAYIIQRTSVHKTRRPNAPEDTLFKACVEQVATAATAAIAAEEAGPKDTPPMLPSPVSLAANSTNSTPASNADGSPAGSSRPDVPPPSANKNQLPNYMLPKELQDVKLSREVTDAIDAVTVPASAQMVKEIKENLNCLNSVARSMSIAEKTLNLPIMARLFPKTFARMVYTTLTVNEEHEPYFDDDEGELFWPGQCVTGEGLGWVCLMGKAMVNEFGQKFGYRGLEGAIPKPTKEEEALHRPISQPPQPLQPSQPSQPPQPMEVDR